jgi:dipeptidyl aminopeptidase/acylaminoacyl peptidase
MRNSALAVLFATVASLRVAAAPLEAPSGILEGRDLFGLQIAADPQIRPDGSAIAYVRTSYDIMTDSAKRAIWLIDVETGAQTPLVSGDGSHSSPRWSPDGQRLAYVSTADGGRPQLYVHWLRTGATARLAELTAAPNGLAWSRDGGSIAFTMFAPDEPIKLGAPPPKPENAEWAEPLQVITDVVYRAMASELPASRTSMWSPPMVARRGN